MGILWTRTGAIGCIGLSVLALVKGGTNSLQYISFKCCRLHIYSQQGRGQAEDRLRQNGRGNLCMCAALNQLTLYRP